MSEDYRNNNLYNTNESQDNEYAPYDATRSNLNWNPQVTTNPVCGWIGAIVGFTIGGALWVLVMQTGYISGYIGAGTLLLGMYGYMLLAKEKISVKKLIIMVLLAAVTIFFSQMIGIAVKLDVDLFLVLQSFQDNSIFKGGVIFNLIFGYAFLGIATFFAYAKLGWIKSN